MKKNKKGNTSAAKKAIRTAGEIKRFFKSSSKKAGLPPGTIFYTGQERDAPIGIQVFNYDTTGLEEVECKAVEEAFSYKESPKTSWINVDGVHDVAIVEAICKNYGVHPLTIEDVVSTDQRPKIEEAEGYLYVVLKMIKFNEEQSCLDMEQVSLILGNQFVISFQEKVGDTFKPVRDRLRAGRGRIRGNGADYLLYALIDTVVDNYFVSLEKVGDKMAELEENLLVNASKNSFDAVYHLKREMLSLRRAVWPLREVVMKLEREEFKLINKNTRVYLRDVYDHTIQVIDTVETYRDLLSGMVDLYHSTIGTRTNDVMKVLTIISTIFIPLTFIVGVYGMNFEIMPELKWNYGYLAVWILMITITVIMILIFRSKHWL